MLRQGRHATLKRGLFQRLAKGPLKEEHDTRHHEYSITPETFAFKANHDVQVLRPGALSGRLRSINGAAGPAQTEPPAHPLQAAGASVNILDRMFRGATNYPFQDQRPQEVFDRYPQTNSARMARARHRPRKTKMLVSDFIEDSLYNPHYGYFSKEVEIFHNDTPFDYNNIQDVDQFMDEWKNAYSRYDAGPAAPGFSEHAAGDPAATQLAVFDKEPLLSPKPTDSRMAKYAKIVRTQDVVAAGRPESQKSLQLWHTPTELFSPYYGEALARHIIVNYKLNGCYPYEDLVIYEMGGGNGTLMCNIMSYIKATEPDIYTRTQYKIIEISSQLAAKQFSQALTERLVSRGLDSRKLEIINKSIFKWDNTVDQPCFFIALEVFDNFAHDVVRYDISTGEPYEGHVLIDSEGDFYQFYTPQLSHYTEAFLQLRENGDFPILPQVDSFQGTLKRLQSVVPFVTDKDKIHPLLHSTRKLAWANRLFPLKDNLSPGEFIPTRLLQFFQILKYRFPNHSLICSDFHSLTNAIPGYYNAPVVQTVIQDKMVDVSTHLCHQGYFDIMFPTDFSLACDLYRKCTGKLAKVELHRDFLHQWADIEATTTKKGDNPMLDFYKNVSFMTS
ncbi:DUF185-domain-containing protein [Metschnikowia bicuspidata var. bicuspidata NRRL YB-4993]|uniref:type II protein arginine methyltransferase n=1 Tax=Metschnikowia bicuspidata var. bicuspidata NRRL YB-4993 TaxID=869754 RepID=A0A1A0HAW0_9ASCO|nr:DUF185-domain-containing protein [Metschnikowia bicuspidata var. bicuspidata NRRL YB-4993]OBA21259.1 DUF185-domain-containing protein [Metschnikowia bicuspidata var. bicuspidata NRRL YB-4993]